MARILRSFSPGCGGHLLPAHSGCRRRTMEHAREIKQFDPKIFVAAGGQSLASFPEALQGAGRWTPSAPAKARAFACALRGAAESASARPDSSLLLPTGDGGFAPTEARAGAAADGRGSSAGSRRRRALSQALRLPELHAGVDAGDHARLPPSLQVLLGLAVLQRNVPLPLRGACPRGFRAHRQECLHHRRPLLGRPGAQRGTGARTAGLGRAQELDSGAVARGPGRPQRRSAAAVAAGGEEFRHFLWL